MSDRVEILEPIDDYETRDWGKVKAEKAGEVDVLLRKARYDPNTGERLEDAIEWINYDELVRTKEMLEKELQQINDKLALYDQAKSIKVGKD